MDGCSREFTRFSAQTKKPRDFSRGFRFICDHP